MAHHPVRADADRTMSGKAVPYDLAEPCNPFDLHALSHPREGCSGT
ncbi:hypothetical protein MPL3356_140201 [Mesorhizobium plurifarium]|uniref:Uncharacterized protein n=1 Tax=Mesorhizobium plurifarium TaxID=69974 RepID=A0A090DD81_MESPL|nr:hypothetical protein MPL3356_140201 [Mesorhizobium plurifarium]